MIGISNLVIVFYILFLGVGLCASFYDFVFYKIPNSLILCSLVLLFLKIMLNLQWGAFIEPAIIFVMLLLAGFALYVANIFGAGDAKFLAISGAWMSGLDLSNFLILSGILAGIISLLYVFAGNAIDTLRNKLWSHMMSLHREKPKWFSFLGSRLEKPFIPNAVSEVKLRQVPVPFGIPMFVASLIVVVRNIWG